MEASSTFYFVASGSHTTTSASAPGMMRPLRGYRLRIFAALELVTATKRFSSIFPPTWNIAEVSSQPNPACASSPWSPLPPACGLWVGQNNGAEKDNDVGTISDEPTWLGSVPSPCSLLTPSSSDNGEWALCKRLSTWRKSTSCLYNQLYSCAHYGRVGSLPSSTKGHIFCSLEKHLPASPTSENTVDSLQGGFLSHSRAPLSWWPSLEDFKSP